jgi:hypothetical protein
VKLTPDQFEAAKASGCTFFPASEAQVHRLAMQRRIFTINGQPFLATRDGGGFFETHATLARLIDDQPPVGERTSEETVQEAEAADAETAGQLAAENNAGRGRAQMIPRRSSAQPRTPWQGNRNRRGT